MMLESCYCNGARLCRPRPAAEVGRVSLLRAGVYVSNQTARRGLTRPTIPRAVLLALVLLTTLTATGQTLDFTNGVHTYSTLSNTTVTMTGRCELRITASINAIPGCVINLNSPDAYFVLQNIRPSSVVASYLSQVRVNGAVAVADSNCRVVQYGVGTAIIPQAPSFQPLQVFSAPHFTGTSNFLGQYIYYKGTGLGALNAAISSFKLKRGYMTTFAQNENGTGISKCYVAQDGDMEVSLLPSDFDDSIRFVYVLPWRWVSKKGVAGDIDANLNVNWKYNWNINQNSTRDVQYTPIRQTRWWPGLGQNWKAMGTEHLLGYNEPDNPVEDAYMTVGDAIWSWPDLLNTGLRVGSPAVTDAGRSSWLYPFMQQADAANLRVDFVAVHYYQCVNPANPASAATQLYNFLKTTYDQVKRPLWLTEWNNGANWTGCGDPTYAQQQAAIAAMIEMLDNTPFVERYAIYNWVEDVRRVKWDDGSLTSAGVTYRDKLSPMGYVQALQENGTRSFTQLRFENDALDTSGYGNNGITSGSPAYTNGHNGQALVFDGTNTLVTLPPNVARGNAFTFAAWINWKGGANWQRIFDFGNSTTHCMFLTPGTSTDTLRFAIKNGGSEQTVQTSAPTVGSWQHVAVTLSGNTARLYVNGTLAASNTGMTISPASFSPRVNFLGKSQFIADPMFNGLMDEVLITDYALSAAQIEALQTNTPPQFTNSIFARGSATEGLSYNNSIAGTATDSDAGDSLTFSKTAGPAWLNVAANGSLTGSPTSGDGGINYFTVRVTDTAGQNAFALVTVTVTTLTASGTWTADASALWGETNRWSGNIIASGAGQTADFSTINITGNRIITLDSSRSIGALKFGDTSGNQTWTITNNGGSALTLNSGSTALPSIVVTNSATISASIAGTNGFAKSGPGTLVLGGNNSLSGTVNIDTGSTSASDGSVRAAHPNAMANVTTIQIRNNNSGSSALQLDGSSGGINISANISLNGRNNSVVPIQNVAGTNTFSGNLAINVGGANYWIQSDAGQLTFSGTISSAAGGTRTFTFSGNGDIAVPGVIANGNAATINVIKSGAGTLFLDGMNTFTGAVTNHGGRLIVNGVVSKIVLVAGTLGGSGRIDGALIIPSGATLTPGNNSVGILTVSNSVTLQPGSVCRFELNKDSLVGNDQLVVRGPLTFAGTLIVTNVGGTLSAGDNFRLFDASGYAGNFSAMTLPAPGVGLAWNTNTFANNGTISVVLGAVSPQFGQFAFDGTNLVATGSGGAAGYPFSVLSATDLNVPLSNWVVVGSGTFDAEGNFICTNVIDASSQQFFRIRIE